MESSTQSDSEWTKEKKGRNRKSFLLLFLFVLVAFLGWNYFSKDPASTARQQFALIKKGEWEEAYNTMSERYKRDKSIENFKQYITLQLPNLTQGALVFYEKKEIANGVVLQGAIDASKEGIVPVEYIMIKEKEHWKIDEIIFPKISFARLEIAEAAPAAEEGKSKESSQPQPEEIVKKQLAALREKKTTEAYYNIVSKAFQSETSLNGFELFLKEYPILTQQKEASIITSSEDKGQAVVKAILDPQGAAVTIEYKLNFEEGAWRIWSMRLIFPAEEAQTYPVFELMAQPVLNQLELLSKGYVEEAYGTYTSLPFKRTTSLEEFTSFVNKFPAYRQNTKREIQERTLQNGMGKLKVALYGLGGVTILEYTVGQEKGIWKVWGVQIVSSPPISTLFSGAAQQLQPSSFRPFNSEDLLKVIEEQLEALKKGDIAKAYYSSSSKQFQAATPLQEFEKFVKSTPILTEKHGENFSKLIFNNNIASFSGILTAEDGKQYPIEYDLIDEEGKWKILQILVFPELELQPMPVKK